MQVLPQAAGIAPPKGENEQLRLLLECLCQQRCLLVLDNAESILRGTSEAEAGDTPSAVRYDRRQGDKATRRQGD